MNPNVGKIPLPLFYEKVDMDTVFAGPVVQYPGLF